MNNIMRKKKFYYYDTIYSFDLVDRTPQCYVILNYNLKPGDLRKIEYMEAPSQPGTKRVGFFLCNIMVSLTNNDSINCQVCVVISAT